MSLHTCLSRLEIHSKGGPRSTPRLVTITGKSLFATQHLRHFILCILLDQIWRPPAETDMVFPTRPCLDPPKNTRLLDYAASTSATARTVIRLYSHTSSTTPRVSNPESFSRDSPRPPVFLCIFRRNDFHDETRPRLSFSFDRSLMLVSSVVNTKYGHLLSNSFCFFNTGVVALLCFSELHLASEGV